MRLSPLLQRCLPGRNVRMLPKELTTEATTAEVGMEVGGGATTSTPKVVEGDMRGEGEEATGEAEGEEQEGATTRVVEEEATEEETTRATFRTLDTTAVEDTTTTTTRTEAGTTRGVGVEDLEEGEGVVVEVGEGAGEEEEGRI